MTPIWALLVLGLVVIVGDRPLARQPGYGEPAGRAALVYRDRENPFFQWGTQLYTEALLAPHYAEVVYVTERSFDDRARFYVAAAAVLGRHAAVDVFLPVHGERRLRLGFAHLPHRERLRVVYSTGCGDARFGDAWLALGADAFVGHDGQYSVSPAFYTWFLRRWVEGRPLGDAVALANTQMANRLGWIGRLIGGAAVGERMVAQTRARVIGDAQLRIGQ